VRSTFGGLNGWSNPTAVGDPRTVLVRPDGIIAAIGDAAAAMWWGVTDHARKSKRV
jgi:hypothetical protein